MNNPKTEAFPALYSRFIIVFTIQGVRLRLLKGKIRRLRFEVEPHLHPIAPQPLSLDPSFVFVDFSMKVAIL